MPTLRVVGWLPNLRKVSLTELWRRELGIPLAEAKALTDRVLAGEPVTFEVEPPARAAAVATELRGLGAILEQNTAGVE